MWTDTWRQHKPTLWPGTCQVCARWPAQPVCSRCITLFGAPAPRCIGCAQRLAGGVTGPVCGACLTRHPPPAVQHCLAAVDYAYPWDGLIARFKFRAEPAWAGPMAEVLLGQAQVRELLQSGALLVPIPVTAQRLAERGYNQSWELIKALRRRLPAPCPPALATALVRLSHTPDQHSLDRAQRLRNLRSAFAAHPDRVEQLRGRAVLLVDDVCTTGATLDCAAHALLQAGTRQIDALVFARTPVAAPDHPD
jgi:ComF family protein